MNASLHHNAKGLLLALSIICLLSACAKREGALTFSGNTDPERIMLEVDKQAVEFEWYAAKIATDMRDQSGKKGFKTNLRLRRDSAIWLSISPALGIEVFRILATQDSLKILDKVNNTYFIKHRDSLDSEMSRLLDFGRLQDLILGQAMDMDLVSDYNGSKDEEGYILTSKHPNTIRKAAGIRYNGRNAFDMQDTTAMYYDRALTAHLIKTEKEEDLQVQQYWIHPETYKTVRSVMSNLYRRESLIAEYSAFETIEDMELPTNAEFRFSNAHNSMHFTMNFSRVKLDRPTTFPFKIPEKFEAAQ